MLGPHQSTFSTGRERRKSCSLLVGSIHRPVLPVLTEPSSEHRGCPGHRGKQRERFFIFEWKSASCACENRSEPQRCCWVTCSYIASRDSLPCNFGVRLLYPLANPSKVSVQHFFCHKVSGQE